MYAIVEIAGQQFKVEEGTRLQVNRLSEPEGSSVTFDHVLLVDNDEAVSVGTPKLENANVSAKIVRHFRDKTVLVFKKKRRKGYQTLNGHRQYLTEVEIEKITA